jgi:hypothetical protein
MGRMHPVATSGTNPDKCTLLVRSEHREPGHLLAEWRAVTPRAVRLAALLAVCAGGLVPLHQASADCGLAPRPDNAHKHVRSGDLDGPVRLYGDSITYQVQQRLIDRNPSLGIDAFWGRWTRETVDVAIEDAERETPRTVVLAIGTNDTRDPSDMAYDVKRAREALPASTRLLWVNTYVETNDGWKDVDAAIASTPGVEVVDWALENLKARGTGDRSPLLSDGVHLSCPGGDVWVDLVQRSVDNASAPHHSAAAGPAVALGDFRYDDWALRADVPPDQRPYARTTPLPPQGTGLVDGGGVRKVEVDRRAYDHPAAQARYGLELLESYRLTHKPRYLALAQAQADRLVAQHVVESGAWFYPLPYDHRGPGDVVHRAPWYSALAQGQALSLLTRLGAETSDPRYLLAADLTFASFAVPPADGRPWVSRVSEDQLWLEQYPAGTSGARTLSGHAYAAFGLWDYWAATGLPKAKTLLQGALTTAVDAARRVRVPGGTSRDGTVYPGGSATGHQVRIQQLLQLQALTGLPQLARLADTLYADAPGPDTAGRLRLLPGAHAGHRFGPDGQVVARRTIRLGTATTVASPHRVRVPGRAGAWLEVGAGPLQGYLVREDPASRYRLGTAAQLVYPLDRTATFRVDTSRLYRVSSSGRLSAYEVDRRVGERVLVDRRAVQNGVLRLRIASGVHRGWWVAAGAVRVT